MRSLRFVCVLSMIGCGSGEPSPAADTSSGGGSSSGGSSSGGSSSGASWSSDSSSGDETTSSTTSSESSDSGAPVDSGLELLVCSFSSDKVSRFDLDDGAWLGDLGPTDDLDGALGIVVGADGDIYVGSEESNMVLRFSGADGSFVARFVADDPATRGMDETGGLSGPGAVLFGPDGSLFVSSFDSDAILRYDGATGAFLDVFADMGVDGPDAGMVFDDDGNLYVPSYYGNAIVRYDSTGASLGDFATDMLDAPRTVLFEGEHMYVANEGTSEVLRFDPTNGAFVDVFVEAGAGGLNGAAGMVFDPSGVLHVASVNNNRVLRFDADGQPLDTLVDAIAGGVSGPTHLTIAPTIAD
ncbi:MAG TPA: hypothetical protein VG755_38295 [Nannocystaceae bacterium]|nr:hypothetical protein [Nannocystaceae bacterium]